MSSLDANKIVVRRFLEEIVNTGDVSRIDEVISPDFVEANDPTGRARGIEAAVEHVLGVRRTYPDLRVTIERQIAEGDWVVTVVTGRGTHLGEWLGIAPTGKPITIRGVNVDRIQDGRIVEHGGAASMLEALLEIGVVRFEGGAPRGETRTHVHEEVFEADPETVFAALSTPSAIRQWWGAARAVVVPETGGSWAVCWGDDEDHPEYVTVATAREFDPPRRLVLADYRYRAKTGPLPFDADFTTTFEVEPHERGALLRVAQAGFPKGPEADAFLAACATGWAESFAGIRRYLAGANS